MAINILNAYKDIKINILIVIHYSVIKKLKTVNRKNLLKEQVPKKSSVKTVHSKLLMIITKIMETTHNLSDFISLVEDLGFPYCQETYWAT